jgi:Flp pilus assembly pilin Flp
MKLPGTAKLSPIREDRAQDVAEYCLITALIALICLGIFWHVSGGLQGMWNSMNASLATTNNSTGAGGGEAPALRQNP